MPDDTEDTADLTEVQQHNPEPRSDVSEEQEGEARHDASGRELHPWEVSPEADEDDTE